MLELLPYMLESLPQILLLIFGLVIVICVIGYNEQKAVEMKEKKRPHLEYEKRIETSRETNHEKSLAKYPRVEDIEKYHAMQDKLNEADEERIAKEIMKKYNLTEDEFYGED